MKNLIRPGMTTEEHIQELENTTIDELLGNEELPLPKEVIEARKQKSSITSKGFSNIGLNSESFYLPSKNLLYGDDFDGHINIRMFTTKEERIRLSSRSSFLETMVSIYNSCISTTNGIEIDTKLLTEFDFIYIMYMSRIVSYGPSYPVTIKCPHCGKTFRYVANLDQLEVKYLEDDFVEPFNIGKLPKSGDEVTLRFLRVFDKIEIEKEAQETLIKFPDYEGDPTFNGNIERRIVTVNGKELNNWEKKQYVENLPAYDVQYINYKMDKASIAGIDTTIRPKCTECGDEFVTLLSLDSTFFRPNFDE